MTLDGKQSVVVKRVGFDNVPVGVVRVGGFAPGQADLVQAGGVGNESCRSERGFLGRGVGSVGEFRNEHAASVAGFGQRLNDKRIGCSRREVCNSVFGSVGGEVGPIVSKQNAQTITGNPVVIDSVPSNDDLSGSVDPVVDRRRFQIFRSFQTLERQGRGVGTGVIFALVAAGVDGNGRRGVRCDFVRCEGGFVLSVAVDNVFNSVINVIPGNDCGAVQVVFPLKNRGVNGCRRNAGGCGAGRSVNLFFALGDNLERVFGGGVQAGNDNGIAVEFQTQFREVVFGQFDEIGAVKHVERIVNRFVRQRPGNFERVGCEFCYKDGVDVQFGRVELNERGERLRVAPVGIDVQTRVASRLDAEEVFSRFVQAGNAERVVVGVEDLSVRPVRSNGGIGRDNHLDNVFGRAFGFGPADVESGQRVLEFVVDNRDVENGLGGCNSINPIRVEQVIVAVAGVSVFAQRTPVNRVSNAFFQAVDRVSSAPNALLFGKGNAAVARFNVQSCNSIGVVGGIVNDFVRDSARVGNPGDCNRRFGLWSGLRVLGRPDLFASGFLSRNPIGGIQIIDSVANAKDGEVVQRSARFQTFDGPGVTHCISVVGNAVRQIVHVERRVDNRPVGVFVSVGGELVANHVRNQVALNFFGTPGEIDCRQTGFVGLSQRGRSERFFVEADSVRFNRADIDNVVDNAVAAQQVKGHVNQQESGNVVVDEIVVASVDDIDVVSVNFVVAVGERSFFGVPEREDFRPVFQSRQVVVVTLFVVEVKAAANEIRFVVNRVDDVPF